MANLFESNPLANDFELQNTSSNVAYLIAGRMLYAGETKTLNELNADFCFFKKEYYQKPATRAWFDLGIILATPINGPSAIICGFENTSSGGGSGTSEDFGRSKSTIDDIVPGFMDDEIIVNESLRKEVVDFSGDKKIKLSIKEKTRTFTNLATWTYNHNYGYTPLFRVVDNNGYPRMFLDFTVTDTNIEIRWDGLMSGTLYLI